MFPFLLITPLAANRDEFFAACMESVAEAVREAGVKVSWRIQVDGVDPEPTVNRVNALADRYVSSDLSIEVSAHFFHGGAARSRSIALYKDPIVLSSDVEWVLTIDADDVFLPDAIRNIMAAITTYPAAHWVAGGVLVQKEPGDTRSLVEVESWEGEVPRGFSAENWVLLSPLIPSGFTEPRVVMDSMEESGLFPIFAASMAYRVSTIWGFGGWPGTPTGEDAALLVRVSDEYPGVVLSEPFIVYRQHSGQNTRHEWHARNKEVSWRMMRAARPNEKLS